MVLTKPKITVAATVPHSANTLSVQCQSTVAGIAAFIYIYKIEIEIKMAQSLRYTWQGTPTNFWVLFLVDGGIDGCSKG